MRLKTRANGDNPSSSEPSAHAIATSLVMKGSPVSLSRLALSDAPWDLDHLPGGGRAPSHRRCNRQTMLHQREPPLRVSREW